MTIKKTGSAHWEGSVKQGKGTVSSESGALKDQPYGFNTRFEDGAGTNPEEFDRRSTCQLLLHGAVDDAGRGRP